MEENKTENLKGDAKNIITSYPAYLGFARYERSFYGNWKLKLNFLKITIACVVAGIAAYFLLLSIIFVNIRYNYGVNTVSFNDLWAYPFSRETRRIEREKIGEFFYKTSQTKDNSRDALITMIKGLQFDPYMPKPRCYYAQILFSQRRTEEAFKFLREGLSKVSGDEAYFSYFIDKCLQMGEDDILIDTYNEFKNDSAISPALKSRFIYGAVQAHFLRGRFLEARNLLKENKMEKKFPALIIESRILWETGEQEKAISLLKKLFDQSNNISLVPILASYYRLQGHYAQARSILSLADVINQQDGKWSLRIMSIYEEENNEYALEKYIEEYFERYKKKPKALFALMAHLINRRDFVWPKKILEQARTESFPDLFSFELLYGEALVLEGRAKEVIDFLGKVKKEKPQLYEEEIKNINKLYAIAAYASGDDVMGKILLSQVIVDRASSSAMQLVVLAKRLDSIGKISEAIDIYRLAYEMDETNLSILVPIINHALKEIDVPMLTQYLPSFISFRRPPRVILEKIYSFLSMDRLLFNKNRNELLEKIREMLDSKEGEKYYSDNQTIKEDI